MNNNNYNQQDGGAPRDTHFGAFSEDQELTREACSCATDDLEDFDEQDEDMAVIQVTAGISRDKTIDDKGGGRLCSCFNGV